MSDRSVGRRSAGRRPLAYDSKATGDAEADGSASLAENAAPVHVSATDPSRTPSGRPRPALRAPLLPVGRQRDTRHTRPMTTPVTVSQSTRQPEARTIPPRPAIVAAPGGRRGEAPGRRTSRRVPASPTISAGDRYGTGESSDCTGAAARRSLPTLVNAYRVATGHRSAGARERGTALRGGVRARRAAAVADPPGTRSQHSKFTTNRGRSHAGTPAVAAVRPPSASARHPADRRSDARVPRARRSPTAVGTTPAGGRAGPRARAARACCKTEIPG